MRTVQLFALGVVVTLSATSAYAQTKPSPGARVISGHVTAVDGTAIAHAVVGVADSLGGNADSTTTDESGKYRIVLRKQQVLMTISATGYATARKVIKESAKSQDIVLRTLADALAPIRITASHAIRAEAPGVLAGGIGAVDNASSGSAANLSPASFAGNILGNAERSAGAMLQRNSTGQIQGVSVLGLSSDQSAVVVDGVVSSGPRIPRDADVAVRVSTSTYDPSQGGFSGAQVVLTTSPGSNISSRYIDVSQSGQVLARSPLGISDISGTASGALSLDHVFYTGSVEVSEQRSAANGFNSRGTSSLSGEDVSSLTMALDTLAMNPTGIGNVRRTRTGIALGRLDFVRDTNLSAALVVHASADATQPSAFSPLDVPGVFGRNADANAGVTASVTHYIGTSLHESRIGIDLSNETVLPYLSAPTYDVRVLQSGSLLGDRRSVTAGSIVDHQTSSGRLNATLEHSIRWTESKEHKLHAGVTAHFSTAYRMPQANRLGGFTFDSVGAFAAGQASSYQRTIQPVDATAHAMSLAGFLGDVWTPRPRMSVQLGSRVDVNRIAIPIGAFGASTTADGLANTSTRTTSLDFSPRLAVTVDKPTSKRSPIAGLTFRGGLGRFVNEGRPEEFLNASIPVRGALAASELNCAGLATPSPFMLPEEAGHPTGYDTCLDGSTASVQQHTGYLLSENWKPASSWRGNVGIVVRTRQQLTLSADFILSRTDRISSIIPLNLVTLPDFVIPTENARPVFQLPESVAGNAAFATGIPRLNDPSLGRVDLLTSNLKSRSRQLLLHAQYWTMSGFLLSSQYAWTKADDQVGGLVSSGGDPRTSEWGPASFVPRHVVTFEAFRGIGSRFSASLTGRVQSGIRYTPLVAGDINGDGIANDRPYIFSPSAEIDSTLRAGLASLLSAAPSGARACLQRRIAHVIARNSCTGPWAAHLDGQLRMSVGSATAIRLDVLNIAAAADRLVHGSNHIHGWGGFGVPDELLYTIAGFDSVTRSYRYQVNPSFGSSRATQALNNPFAIRLSVLVSFGRDPSAQQLSIDSSRVTHPTYDQLVDRYVSHYPNVALDLLNVSDSVDLRPQQMDTLRALARTFNGTMRTIWGPIARAIQQNPNDIAAQSRRILAARTPAAINYEAYRRLVLGVLDRNQLARLPFWPRFDLGENALRSMGLSP